MDNYTHAVIQETDIHTHLQLSQVAGIPTPACESNSDGRPSSNSDSMRRGCRRSQISLVSCLVSTIYRLACFPYHCLYANPGERVWLTSVDFTVSRQTLKYTGIGSPLPTRCPWSNGTTRTPRSGHSTTHPSLPIWSMAFPRWRHTSIR